MRLGSNSRLKGLVCYSLSAAILFSTFPRPAHANPVLIGIAEVFGSIIARRAALTAAEAAADAAFTARVANATYKGVEAAAAARKLIVPANSALRTAGKVTWGALNVAGGVMTATELLDAFHNDKLSVATDGVALGDGKYEVKVGGVTQTVDFQPSPDNPVILYGSSTAVSPGTGTGTDTGTVPRVVTVENLPINKGVETFPTPDNVVQTKALDNSKAAYTFNTDTVTGDLYYIEDARMESLQNAFITATARHYENYVWSDTVSHVVGDNTSFDYVIESRTMDILDFTVSEQGSAYPEVGSALDNAITYYKAAVPVVIHDKKIKSSYKSCEYVKVTETDGTTSSKKMCTPPTEDDYAITESRESYSSMLSLNFNYTGNALKPAETTEPAKVVTATELADLLSDTQLDNWTVADMLTDLLSQAASKAGYEGVPFTDDDYITDTEVANALKSLNGTLTAASLMTSAEDKNGNIVISNTTNVGGDTSNETTIEAKVDLGEDPNIKSPELEETPTGKQILAPIQESMPFLNDFKITGRDAQCPVARFSVFDHDYVIDKHCDLIEQNRKLIELFVSILWAFVALRAVLKA
ncbi:hypothetical protein NBY25_25085 (plasmid) [Escherichia coli]|uniref:hypothetical protein n=1 Tax=Escherichia coli TaxID=562 RepID=UPI001BD4E0AE|nr:hypothetical protein [Escherichia coli]MBS9691169.1 hypothetical protein [Escherichia coli]URU66951.1 hypothetical protein NBY25_25130 [Escherichia coli]URU66962.1 hypothetical protein NBY25_25085 [Escherichia coli]